MPEGELTRIRSSLVCEKSLCGVARKISLGEYLLLSRGEQHTGGRERDSILADAFEALLAAIYIDGGMEEADRFVVRFVLSELREKKDPSFHDYKTALQEVIQQNPEEMLEYVLVEASGPDHDKHFVVEVRINSNVVGQRRGTEAKKTPSRQAAHEALKLIGDVWISAVSVQHDLPFVRPSRRLPASGAAFAIKRPLRAAQRLPTATRRWLRLPKPLLAQRRGSIPKILRSPFSAAALPLCPARLPSLCLRLRRIMSAEGCFMASASPLARTRWTGIRCNI